MAKSAKPISWWRILIVLFLLLAGGSVLLITRMPLVSYSGPLPALTAGETEIRDNLGRHVAVLAGTIGERNIWQDASMERAAGYIESALTGLGYRVERQNYEVRKTTVSNLEVELKGSQKPEEIVVVGAHYDSVAGSPGANDNASGVAALLELARLLKNADPERTVRLVAFANEESPFYLSGGMGSRRYAARCRQRREKIVAMLSLETIGWYSDAPHSQKYPPPFSLFYPDTADFIGFVGNLASRNLVRRSIAAFRRHARFPSEGTAAPGWLTGIGWSDHSSFWKEGYKAIMITDTALFRYPAYHRSDDTPEKLKYSRMARVVAGLVWVVKDLAGD